jgi:hypothetical protein
MVIITGLGRCGTSILTKYFKELGFGLGRNVHWHEQVRAGYELSTFYSLVDDLYQRYCKKGLPINLDDKCLGDYWKGNTYRKAFDKVDKDDRQGYIDLVKDPRITWHPDIIEALWEVRRDIKLIICHRKVELIYNSRKSLPIQYDDPKPRKELNEYKIDFCDFYTKVLELNIPHEIIMFPYFLRDFNVMYNKLKVILPHDFESGKKVFDKIVDGSLLK